ncbi:hypothetical protein [Hoyosella altamirensis]|uniref:Head-to-tail adaptor n=1 Tax=Hoyosella altamirensis TaxID=616997 RepID=A0A839RUV7_9ACTN|nr:hypothetical protein [Hoyosella altamirensis]MBB3040129.1 hypothetical protein [Hoyosella altamirensis]
MAACEWTVDDSCLPAPESEYDRARLQDAKDAAVRILWSLTGRQYGVCPAIARPCPPPCLPRKSGPGWFPELVNGAWINVCKCEGGCTWLAPSVIHLPGPVDHIIKVTIDGTDLDETAYALEGDLLYRTNGIWPSQNLTKPLGSPGSWSVTYGRGAPPPAGLATAAGILAKEFFAACCNTKCRLPARVQAVVRNGVSVTMTGPDIFAEGLTGIPEIDIQIQAANPNRLAQRSRAV